jgi:hypothetical protein
MTMPSSCIAPHPPDRTLHEPVLWLPPDWLPDAARSGWAKFAQSWDNLPADEFMADGGRYRHRRYAAFDWAGGGPPVRLPHRPHYQDIAFNPLNGGVERWFAPIDPAVSAAPLFRHILQGMAQLVEQRDAVPHCEWMVEAHQFRIVAKDGQPGLPTPEGMHRDGRDWVLILLANSINLSGGETVVEDLHGSITAHHRLSKPGEGVLLDDRRVRHATSPIRPAIAGAPAWRDTLVVTFARGRFDS